MNPLVEQAHKRTAILVQLNMAFAHIALISPDVLTLTIPFEATLGI